MTAEEYISNFAQQFSTGQYEALVENYDFPLPIYINRAAAVARDPRDVRGFFQALHALILARGFSAVSGRVVSAEEPQRNRFRLWVEWSGVAGDRSELLFKSVCYNAGSHDRHRTEMFALETGALPEIERLIAAA